MATTGRRRRDILEERRFLGPLLIAPAVLFIALLVGAPLILAIYLSLTDATAGSLSGEFVGFRNYVDAWDSENFRRALRNTVIFTLVSQAIVIVGAGILAHALVRPFRGRWLLRLLVLLPWAAPVALSTVGFLWIFHSLYSVVNWTLTHDIVPGSPAFFPYRALNWAFARDFWPSAIQITPIEPVDPPQWLGEPNLAMASIIFAHAWRILPTTWENIRRAAPRLKAMGHPVGIGMSNELDSNMALIALLQNYGSFIQSRDARVTIKNKGTVEALKFMRDLYKRGMTNSVFAWTAASNNDEFLAGRLSLALNAISIARSAELRNLSFNRNIGILPIAKGPAPRRGLEHVMGVYVIWKFAQNKAAAKKYLVDIGTKYTGHFLNSYFYNFPTFPRSVSNIKVRLAKQTDYPNEFRGRYTILDEISKKYTFNVGYPGYSNAAIDEVFSKFLIPQMFARVARDEMTPDEAMRAAHREISSIFKKWRGRRKI